MLQGNLIEIKSRSDAATAKMLNLKYRKTHNIQDARWTTGHKLIQYRGILKLYARDKKLRQQETTSLKKKVSKELKVLKADVKLYRDIAKAVAEGDKRRVETVLKDHKDLFLAHHQSNPNDVYEAVYQDNDQKRRQLDKLYYEKKKKMKHFFDLKLQHVQLNNKYEEEQAYKEPNKEHQQLIARFHDSIAKHNAARTIHMAYLSMTKILKNDAVYFDALLSALKNDQTSQCSVMLKAIMMGQLATENLDDIREKYKRMAKDVLVNMKERERTINNARAQVEDLWAYIQSLVNVESPTERIKKTDPTRISDVHLEQQLQFLEGIFEKVRGALLVRSYYDIFGRIQEQIRQKGRLLAQYTYNLKERDSSLNKRNHAMLILANLEHSIISTTGEYKAEKKNMLSQLETEKKRELDFKNLRMSQGELLLNIKSALQNMIDMLVCVQRKRNGKKTGKRSLHDTDQLETEENLSERHEKECSLDKIEKDVLAMLAIVTQKATALFAMSNFELDEDKEQKAKDLYRSYVSSYRSNLKFNADELEMTELYVEHETVDSSVPTRTDIKLLSKSIIEANTKLAT